MNDFKIIQTLFSSGEMFDIHRKWKNFPLKKLDDYKKELKNKSGIYVIESNSYGILYIGKAKSIRGRLTSHLKATEGKEKSPAWKQFFEYFKSNLRAYYLVTDTLFSENSGENGRQIIERALQMKYAPLFDQIFPTRQRKKLNNFEERIKSLKHSKYENGKK